MFNALRNDRVVLQQIKKTVFENNNLIRFLILLFTLKLFKH